MKKRELEAKKFEEERCENVEANSDISCKTPENSKKKRALEYASNINVLRSPSPTPIPVETLNNLARTPKSPGLSASLWKDKKMSVSSQHSAVSFPLFLYSCITLLLMNSSFFVFAPSNYFASKAEKLTVMKRHPAQYS